MRAAAASTKPPETQGFSHPDAPDASRLGHARFVWVSRRSRCAKTLVMSRHD
jgi:hypothetical protein